MPTACGTPDQGEDARRRARAERKASWSRSLAMREATSRGCSRPKLEPSTSLSANVSAYGASPTLVSQSQTCSRQHTWREGERMSLVETVPRPALGQPKTRPNPAPSPGPPESRPKPEPGPNHARTTSEPRPNQARINPRTSSTVQDKTTRRRLWPPSACSGTCIGRRTGGAGRSCIGSGGTDTVRAFCSGGGTTRTPGPGGTSLPPSRSSRAAAADGAVPAGPTTCPLESCALIARRPIDRGTFGSCSRTAKPTGPRASWAAACTPRVAAGAAAAVPTRETPSSAHGQMPTGDKCTAPTIQEVLDGGDGGAVAREVARLVAHAWVGSRREEAFHQHGVPALSGHMQRRVCDGVRTGPPPATTRQC